MKSKPAKKKYEAPKIQRVVLSHDQAILAGCSTSTTSTSTGGGWCRSNCRQSTTTGAQSASRS